jgi:uncharacterized protein with HEPN domain
LPSSRPNDRYADIVANIDAIGRYTAGINEAQYLADPKTQDATITCFMRISEAAAKLGLLAEQLAPEQPWGEIRGLGNKLRHEYDRVEPTILWRTITRDLASLREACERSIQHLQP